MAAYMSPHGGGRVCHVVRVGRMISKSLDAKRPFRHKLANICAFLFICKNSFNFPNVGLCFIYVLLQVVWCTYEGLLDANKGHLI